MSSLHMSLEIICCQFMCECVWMQEIQYFDNGLPDIKPQRTVDVIAIVQHIWEAFNSNSVFGLVSSCNYLCRENFFFLNALQMDKIIRNGSNQTALIDTWEWMEQSDQIDYFHLRNLSSRYIFIYCQYSNTPIHSYESIELFGILNYSNFRTIDSVCWLSVMCQ